MPGKNKKGGGLESSPQGYGEGKSPFTMRSGNTTPFKQMGSSPLKQDKVKQAITTGVSKNINTPGWKTTTVTTTGLPNQGTSSITTLDKTGQVVGESGGSASKSSSKPKWDPTKKQDVSKYVKGTKAYKTANPSNLSKVAKTGKSLLGKVGKFLGGKALGTAGFFLGSMSAATADQPTKNKGKVKYPGGKIDFTK